MTKRLVLENWASTAPARFRFAIKASQRITHLARLKPESAESLGYLYDNSRVARRQTRTGAVPYAAQPEGRSAATEGLSRSLTRRSSRELRVPQRRVTDEACDALRAKGAALCLLEREDAKPPPLFETARWGYMRLRLERYAEADLET